MERLIVGKQEAINSGDIDKLVEVDTKFHELLYQSSRNDRLATIISNLREQIQRFRLTSLSFPGRNKESLREHKQLLEAIQARDSQLARQLAQEHIENAENVLLECIKMEELGQEG